MRAAAFFLLIAGISPAQVQNAADARVGVQTTTLAPGSLAVVNFSNSPATSATVSLLPANSTTSFPAQVTSVVPYSITFVVPENIPLGDAQLIYKPGTQATQWTRVSIVPASFSLFRSGNPGPLVAQNINPNGAAVANGLATPAQPGQPVILWGSGLGATPQSAIQITLGGVAQTLLYAGAAPGQPGLNQINFQIAAGTPDSCYLPLAVTYGTQTVTSFLSKTSDGSPCQHPFQLSLPALQQLDGGGEIQSGEITLTTGLQAASSDIASRQESAQFQYLYLAAPQLANYFVGRAINSAQPCSSTGTVTNNTSGVFLEGVILTAPFGAMTLQSGTSILAVPWVSPKAIDTPLNNLPPPFITGGNWTWSAAGGATLPASSFNFVLPPPIQIAGGAPITLNRSQNQTITWDGSGFDSTAILQLSLTAQYLSSPVLTCSVPAQGGAVTLPSNLLAQFNAGAAGAVSVSVSESGSGIPHKQFNLLNGGGPFLMLMNWNSTDARPVDFQ